MAKFIVTSGTNYQPFTYEELSAPVMQAAEAHRQTQDVYDSIGAETAAIQSYIAQEPEGSLAKSMYQGYLDQLTALQDNLWNNGYNAQTRRDLYAAKAGFSDKILRLQNAIQTRQERSAKYWEKANDKSNVMGRDPGAYSLDEYIRNDRFGQDFYSYNGGQFTNEVGADAQARIKELFDKYGPDVRRYIPGYYTFEEQGGVRSADVAAARDAVLQRHSANGSDELYNNLDEVGKVLADVLESHLISTGAIGNVSQSELNRLINYGADGLSRAIGETKYQHLDDWQSKEATQHANRMEEIAAQKAGNGDEEDTRGVGYEGHISHFQPDEFKPFSKGFSWDEKQGTVTINNPDGTTSDYNEPVSFALDIFNPEVRQLWRENMHIDVAMEYSNINGNKKNRQFVIPLGDDTLELTAHRPKNKDGIDQEKKYGAGAENPIIFTYEASEYNPRTGKYENVERVHETFTKNYNAARKEYQDGVNGYYKNNPDINLKKLAGDLYPEKEIELRKEKGYDNSVPTADIYDIERTKNNIGSYHMPALVTMDDWAAPARTTYSNRIYASWRDYKNSGELKKGTPWAFEVIGKGNQPTGNEVTELVEIYGGKTSNGQTSIDLNNGLLGIFVTPEDMVLNDNGDGYPKIRIQGNGNTSMVRTTAGYLGPTAYESLKGIMPYITRMMEPITHPDRVSTMTDEEAAQWTLDVFRILNGDKMQDVTLYDLFTDNVAGLKGPQVMLDYSTSKAVTAKDILHNETLRQQLHDYADEICWDALKGNLDVTLRQHPQYVGNSSQNALPIR